MQMEGILYIVWKQYIMLTDLKRRGFMLSIVAIKVYKLLKIQRKVY